MKVRGYFLGSLIISAIQPLLSYGGWHHLFGSDVHVCQVTSSLCQSEKNAFLQLSTFGHVLELI